MVLRHALQGGHDRGPGAPRDVGPGGERARQRRDRFPHRGAHDRSPEHRFETREAAGAGSAGGELRRGRAERRRRLDDRGRSTAPGPLEHDPRGGGGRRRPVDHRLSGGGADRRRPRIRRQEDAWVPPDQVHGGRHGEPGLPRGQRPHRRPGPHAVRRKGDFQRLSVHPERLGDRRSAEVPGERPGPHVQRLPVPVSDRRTAPASRRAHCRHKRRAPRPDPRDGAPRVRVALRGPVLSPVPGHRLLRR